MNKACHLAKPSRLFLNSVAIGLALIGLAACSSASSVSHHVKDQEQQQSKSLLSSQVATQSATQHDVKPTTIIMVIADGMGPAFTTAYRNYKDNPDTAVVELTALDKVLTGSARTYPAKQSGWVTDSAASATALSTGIKTYNGAIAVDINKQPLETVLHRAKKLGKKTGVAVTSQIVHATPASYIAHNESRRNYNQIADSFLDDRINNQLVADVMLGGGWEYFIRDDRNLVNEFKALGYQYADSYEALAGLEKGKPTLGLFANVGLPWALDDPNPKRLSVLTEQATKQLENPKGFFLLVEASQVDWAGHANDIAGAMAEMADLEHAIIYLQDYVETNPDTLVVLTADHSTGGLTIGAKGEYRWSPEFLTGISRSVQTIASQLMQQDDKVSFLEAQLGFVLEDQAKNDIAAIPLDAKPRTIEAAIKLIIDAKTNTGWTTSGHTGIDVEVYSFGTGADHFKGNMNNTDIADKIFRLLGQ